MPLDPRTPILAAVAQNEQRVDDPREGLEPLELMFRAADAAARDAGSRKLLAAADAVCVPRGIWRYGDPARAVAERIGAPGARTVGTPFGGNLVQSVLNHYALAIQHGDAEVAVLTGAECGNSQRLARAAGIELAWSEAPGAPDRVLGTPKPWVHEAEAARSFRMPVQFYPLVENAIRYACGEGLEEHLVRISELWAGFSAVAVDNPHAWIREPISAEEIRTPSPRNRMISFPYPKLMNSNSSVDQGAALVLCSVEAARRFGVPRERWVFPHAGTDANDHYTASQREHLHASPAIRLAGGRALELAGLSVADLDYVDLYSCFPSAVQVAAGELALPPDRALTVTGGLTFGGGPMNNYVMHAIARTAELLRARPGAWGLVTGNGGNLSKHSFGVYSAAAPEQPFRHANLQAEVDKTPSREAVVDWEGLVTIESYVVMYGPEGPAVAHVACLLPDGRRTWANAGDPDLLVAMTREEFCGRPARVDGRGGLVVRA